MKISRSIFFKGFKSKVSKKKIFNLFKKLINEDNQILQSLNKSYKNSYNPNIVKKLKKYSEINLIGMGGSSLGAQSIYSFLKEKVKKKFIFFDSLNSIKLDNKFKKINLIL